MLGWTARGHGCAVRYKSMATTTGGTTAATMRGRAIQALTWPTRMATTPTAMGTATPPGQTSVASHFLEEGQLGEVHNRTTPTSQTTGGPTMPPPSSMSGVTASRNDKRGL